MKTFVSILLVGGCALGLLIYIGNGLAGKLQLTFCRTSRTLALKKDITQVGSNLYLTFKFETESNEEFSIIRELSRRELNVIEGKDRFEIDYLKSDPSVTKIVGYTDYSLFPMFISLILLLVILFRVTLVLTGKLSIKKFY